jgi:putative copper resistance protein D
MTTALLVLARTIHIGSAMMLVALPIFTAFILRPARTGGHFDRGEEFCRRIIRLLWAALIVEIVSGAIWLWLVAAEMSDDSPWGGLTLSDVETVLFQTNFGQLWIGRGLALVILAVLLGWLGRGGALHRRTSHPVTWLFVIVGVGLPASLAWAGHAGAGARWHAWHLIVDVIHLGAGTVWPLGLFPLTLFLRRSLRETGGFVEIDAAVVRRFSRASLVAVLVLVSSGVANSWLMLPSWGALFASTYGRLLLGKILVVAIMLCVGAFNRFRLLSALPQRGAPRLVRMVVTESILALVVLLIVGLMGTTPPPDS